MKKSELVQFNTTEEFLSFYNQESPRGFRDREEIDKFFSLFGLKNFYFDGDPEYSLMFLDAKDILLKDWIQFFEDLDLYAPNMYYHKDLGLIELIW